MSGLSFCLSIFVSVCLSFCRLCLSMAIHPSICHVSFSVSLQYTFVRREHLPPHVHLLTLEVMSEGKYLLRLENYMETGDPVSVSLEVSMQKLWICV